MTAKQAQGAKAPDGSDYVVLTDGAGNLAGAGAAGYPTPVAAGAIYSHASSGNVAAAVASATVFSGAAVTAYIAGFLFTFSGATAASVVIGTITGLSGGTQSFIVPVPAGVAVGGVPISVQFDPPIPASAVNTNIVVSVPSLGAGNTNAAVSAWGYRV